VELVVVADFVVLVEELILLLREPAPNEVEATIVEVSCLD
jgi:hypothetical protein